MADQIAARDYFDARIEAIESRQEAKLADIHYLLQKSLDKSEQLSNKSQEAADAAKQALTATMALRHWMVGTVLAVGAVLLTTFMFAFDIV